MQLIKRKPVQWAHFFILNCLVLEKPYILSPSRSWKKKAVEPKEIQLLSIFNFSKKALKCKKKIKTCFDFS